MKAFLLDIDGTTLLGEEALPGALDFIAWLRERAVPHRWITNNTSRSRAGWLERLARAGLDPAPAEIYTAGDATIDFLRDLAPVPSVHLVGTKALAEDFRAGGLDLVDASDDPDVLVLGYDTELTYAKLSGAALLLRRGVRFVATHPDLNCPSPDGPLPDVGSFLALLEASTGRRPEIVGKPRPAMALGALGRLGVAPPDAVMVGDRLETDIRMANDAGMTSFLVLSGATNPIDLAHAADRPTRTFASLEEVLAYSRGAISAQ